MEVVDISVPHFGGDFALHKGGGLVCGDEAFFLCLPDKSDAAPADVDGVVGVGGGHPEFVVGFGGVDDDLCVIFSIHITTRLLRLQLHVVFCQHKILVVYPIVQIDLVCREIGTQLLLLP